MPQLANSRNKLAVEENLNPLIEDLIGDLAVRRPSVSSGFSTFTPQLDSKFNGSVAILAVEAIIKAAHAFTRTLQVYQLDDYVSKTKPRLAKKELRHVIQSKKPAEVEALLIELIDLLEDIRVVRGEFSPLDGSNRGRERSGSDFSTFSTYSTASLMRPPVHETNQLDMAFDRTSGKKVINRYLILAELGQGSYGKVKLGESIDTRQKVAIKIIDKHFLTKRYGKGSESDSLKREIAVMKKVRHRHCVSLYEVIDDPTSNKLYMIMDYIPNGPVVRLKQLILLPAMLTSIEADIPVNNLRYCKHLIRCGVRNSNDGEKSLTGEELSSSPTIVMCNPIREDRCALYLRQLVSGLRYLHKRHVVHHDIKPDNILLDKDHNIYLTDFGVSEMLEISERDNQSGKEAAAAKLGAGTLLFTAPELFSNSAADADPFCTDIWALGVTLYSILIGMVPFRGTTYGSLRQAIQTSAFPWSGTTIHNDEVLPEWKVILDGLLQKDPTKRWTLTELKDYLDAEKFQGAIQLRCILSSAVSQEASALNLDVALLNCAGGSGLQSPSHKFREITVSQLDLQKATRTERVQVFKRPTKPLSEDARTRVHRYIQRLREGIAANRKDFYGSPTDPQCSSTKSKSMVELLSTDCDRRGSPISFPSTSLSQGRMQVLDAMLSIINVESPSHSVSFAYSPTHSLTSLDVLTTGTVAPQRRVPAKVTTSPQDLSHSKRSRENRSGPMRTISTCTVRPHELVDRDCHANDNSAATSANHRTAESSTKPGTENPTTCRRNTRQPAIDPGPSTAERKSSWAARRWAANSNTTRVDNANSRSIECHTRKTFISEAATQQRDVKFLPSSDLSAEELNHIQKQRTLAGTKACESLTSYETCAPKRSPRWLLTPSCNGDKSVQLSRTPTPKRK